MLMTLLAFVFALGLLVTFHELGHYWIARLSGVQILRFSVGFGPILLQRRDRHGTQWALSAIPLGGYVKMLDAASETQAGDSGRAFEQQALYRRVAIVLAGPLANLLLAALLYAFLGMWGTYQPVARLAAPAAGSIAAQAGIQADSTIISVAGTPVQSWPQARWRLLEPLATGQAVELELHDSTGASYRAMLKGPAQRLAPDEPDPLTASGLLLASPQAVAGEIMPDSAAWRAGLQSGDRILSIGARQAPDIREFIAAVQAHPGQSLPVVVERQGTEVRLTLLPEPVADDAGQVQGRIGAMMHGDMPRVLVREGPVDSIATGIRRTAEMSWFTLRMLGRMVTGSASLKNISGPVTIAEYAGQTARLGLQPYLEYLALISLSIGILNLLPIPMLDGGHLLFYLIEALRGGRPLSEAARATGLRFGLLALAGLMGLALYNDFARLFS